MALIFFLGLAFLAAANACSNGNCKLRDSCSMTEDCGSGLFCSYCPEAGMVQPICIREKATNVTSIVNGLPFNKYTWLMTHNAFAITEEPSHTGTARYTFDNQEDTVTDQLNNGVRGLMLDMYDFMDDIWLCHSIGGQCYNYTAFEPAVITLKEVEKFLSANPTEIITIILEDYVHASKGLTRVFTDAGLMKYMFPLSKMPKNGKDWPTITDMVAHNQRLLVFTSNSSKEAIEGIAYQWNYTVENKYGYDGTIRGSCSNREESLPLNSKNVSLFLQNYFLTIPNQNKSCNENSSPLYQMINTCYQAAGNRMPNFIAVDFYLRSDGGGAFEAVDKINGQTLCGCPSIQTCQPGAAYGVCRSAPLSSQSTAPFHSYWNNCFICVITSLFMTRLSFFMTQ